MIGHSYGSTVIGRPPPAGATSTPTTSSRSEAPACWSIVPTAESAPGGNVYVMRAVNDVIGVGGIVTEWTLGADPADPGFGARRLAAVPGPPVLSGCPASRRTAVTG